MGALILFAVHTFHLGVFSALAYWMAGSKQFTFTPRQASGWFVAGAVIANVVLCAMLVEVGSGMAILSNQTVDDDYFSRTLKTALIIQPVFGAVLYFLVQSCIKIRRSPRS